MKIGEKRQFSFVKHICVVQEILENPGISMWWTWKHDICPHCKKEIEKRLLHVFTKIEISIPQNKTPETVTKEELVVIGFAKDGRIMNLTIDKIEETLVKSTKFKHLAEDNKKR